LIDLARSSQAINRKPQLAARLKPPTAGRERLLFSGLSLGSFNLLELRYRKVISVDARVIDFVKAHYRRVFDAALVDGGDGAHFTVPIRLLTEDTNLRTTLNHEQCPL
jgi:hypothetical protein